MGNEDGVRRRIVLRDQSDFCSERVSGSLGGVISGGRKRTREGEKGGGKRGRVICAENEIWSLAFFSIPRRGFMRRGDEIWTGAWGTSIPH
jgi:hypothetical protein